MYLSHIRCLSRAKLSAVRPGRRRPARRLTSPACAHKTEKPPNALSNDTIGLVPPLPLGSATDSLTGGPAAKTLQPKGNPMDHAVQEATAGSRQGTTQPTIDGSVYVK